jgi:hypothetical protein
MLLVDPRSTTLMRAMRNLMLLVILAAGCGSAPGFGNPHVVENGGGCSGAQEGIIVLAWTIRGAAPTATTCTGMLSLDLEFADCGVTIEPIPCALDHWRYDHLPEGVATATLSSSGVSGTATVDLSSSVPSSPTAIDLQ